MQDGISTHALTEGDDHRSFRTPGRSHFNSRPHGGRPEETLKAAAVATISTHALTEGDVFSSVKSMHAFNFNSRPHGGRHMPDSSLFQCPQFQLTPSRRATRCTVHLVNLIEISTHALTEGDQFTTALRLSFFISTHALTEGDILPACILIQNCIFQLTPSRRATLCCSIGIYGATFQLTPSRRATDYIAELFAEFHISTHALTEGD